MRRYTLCNRVRYNFWSCMKLALVIPILWWRSCWITGIDGIIRLPALYLIYFTISLAPAAGVKLWSKFFPLERIFTWDIMLLLVICVKTYASLPYIIIPLFILLYSHIWESFKSWLSDISHNNIPMNAGLTIPQG